MKIFGSILFFLFITLSFGQTIEIQSNENNIDLEFKANSKINNKFKEINDLTIKIQIYAEIKNDTLIEIYIKNNSKDVINLSRQDRKLYLIQEAKNKNGEWKPIEYWSPSWCGNSYGNESIKPNNIIKTQSKNYNGEFETEIRFKLLDNNITYFSNNLKGKINFLQFIISEKAKIESHYLQYENVAGKEIAEKIIFLQPNGFKEYLVKEKVWKKEMAEKRKKTNN